MGLTTRKQGLLLAAAFFAASIFAQSAASPAEQQHSSSAEQYSELPVRIAGELFIHLDENDPLPQRALLHKFNAADIYDEIRAPAVESRCAQFLVLNGDLLVADMSI
eukprot:15245-Heterococcus_DN1.PRE.2